MVVKLATQPCLILAQEMGPFPIQISILYEIGNYPSLLHNMHLKNQVGEIVNYSQNIKYHSLSLI